VQDDAFGSQRSSCRALQRQYGQCKPISTADDRAEHVFAIVHLVTCGERRAGLE
jgi:hypothetical protein